MKCKICNRNYRYCYLTSLIIEKNANICSYTCWEKTEKYINTHKKFESFIKDMDTTQLKKLNWLFEEVDFEIYTYTFQNIVLDKLKDKKEN